MNSHRRIVVRSPNWLGDAVMSLPALRAIRRQFDGAMLAVAAPAFLTPLYRHVAGVDDTVSLPVGPYAFGARRWTDEARILSAGQFDLAILFPNSFGSALAAHRARIRERWGYRSDLRGWLLTRAVPRRPRAEELRHHAHHYQELVRGLGIQVGTLDATIEVSEDARRDARVLLGRHGCEPGAVLIGIAIGAANGRAKVWPPDRMAEVIIRLSRELGATCLLLGSTGDRSLSRAIESAIVRLSRANSNKHSAPVVQVVNLTGETDLHTLIGVISLCRTFVSNDSGAMHLAASVGLPVTAVFGPTDERATSPLGVHEIVTHAVWCRPCLLRECPIDHRCMTRIPAAAVFDAVSRQFHQPPGAPQVG